MTATAHAIKITLYDKTEEFKDFDTHEEMTQWAKEQKAYFRVNRFVVRPVKREGQNVSIIGFRVSKPARYGGEILATYEVN